LIWRSADVPGGYSMSAAVPSGRREGKVSSLFQVFDVRLRISSCFAEGIEICCASAQLNAAAAATDPNTQPPTIIIPRGMIDGEAGACRDIRLNYQALA
jgi:hypothetical protein